MRTPRTTAPALLALALLLTACSGGDDAGGSSAPSPTGDETTTTTTAPTGDPIVLSGQGNALVAYAASPPFTRQVVIEPAAEDPEHGLDINGQICFDPADPRRFVAGEDTAQSPENPPGWGVFELRGGSLGHLEATELARLVPTYQDAESNPENYGCGFLPDGRIVTTDIGNQAAGPATGQLIVWFPPFEGDRISYCKVDVALATGQAIAVVDDAVLVAQARGPGVFRYPMTDLPTGPTPGEGCDSTDATGAPRATGVAPELLVAPDDTNRVATPNGLAVGPDGHLYVSSAVNGVIAEFDLDGTFRRIVLEPPPGETLGARPYSTGTPLGLAVGPDGTLYYADLGIVITDAGIGPGTRTGTVRRITFTDGEPDPPAVMDSGLAFPDGLGVWLPPA